MWKNEGKSYKRRGEPAKCRNDKTNVSGNAPGRNKTGKFANGSGQDTLPVRQLIKK